MGHAPRHGVSFTGVLWCLWKGVGKPGIETSHSRRSPSPDPRLCLTMPGAGTRRVSALSVNLVPSCTK